MENAISILLPIVLLILAVKISGDKEKAEEVKRTVAAEAMKSAVEQERLRMYEAIPHRFSWYSGCCELEMDTIHVSTSGSDPHDRTYQISEITNISRGDSFTNSQICIYS